MSKKGSRSNQKVYKMRGCSKNTRRRHLGGSTDAPLAYTGEHVFSLPNPNLAYTGKQPLLGGAIPGSMINTPMAQNTNGGNPAYPNTGPPKPPSGGTIFNSVMPQHGGTCSSCNNPLMTGGCCGCGSGMTGGRRRKSRKNKGGTCGLCAMGFMVGGTRHRVGCKCSDCKSRRISRSMKGGNPGIPYPGGSTGSPWGANNNQLPGADGIGGNRNHYALNTYSAGDPQTSMVDVGANPPFLNMKGGKRNQKGGTLSNFIGQDLINLGRQFQYGLGSAYNALAGYSSPINPMPWKGQFPIGAPMNPVRPIV